MAFLGIRSMCFFLWFSNLPNNLTSISDYLPKDHSNSILKKIWDGRFEKSLAQDFDTFPDYLTFSMHNLNFTNPAIFSNGKKVKLSILMTFECRESLVYFDELYNFQDLVLRHNLKIEIKTKTDFLKFLQEEIKVKIIIEMEFSNIITGISKIHVEQFFEENNLKINEKKRENKKLEITSKKASFLSSNFDLENNEKEKSDVPENRKNSRTLMNESFANFEYQLILNTEKELHLESIVSKTLNRKKIDTLCLKIFAAFGLNKSHHYNLKVTSLLNKLQNIQSYNENIKIESPPNKNRVEIFGTDHVAGPNPTFDFCFKFDFTSENQMETFEIDILILECVAIESGMWHEMAKLTVSVSQFYLQEKYAVVSTLKGLDTKSSPRSVLYAIYNPHHFSENVKILDSIYNKTWFLRTAEKISRVIKFKKGKREIILPFVFDEKKTKIESGEFLRSVLNVDLREFKSTSVKCVISDLSERIVVFENLFEFELFWKLMFDSEELFNPKIKENGETKLEDDKSRNEEITNNKNQFISFAFFKYLFFEICKNEEKPENVSIEQKTEIKEVTYLIEASEIKPTAVDVPKKLTITEIITEFQLKLKKYQNNQKLTYQNLIDEFDLNGDGKMQKEEFTKFVNKFTEKLAEEEIISLFGILDKKNDGFLTPSVLLKILELEAYDLLKFNSNDQYFEEKYMELHNQKLTRDFTEQSHRVLQKYDISFLQLLEKCNLFDRKTQKIKTIDLQDFIGISKSIFEMSKIKDEDLEIVFKNIDLDKNGTLSLQEISDFMNFEKVFSVLANVESSGQIPPNEFLVSIYEFASRKKLSLEKLFESIDTDQSGFLTKQELYVFFKKLDISKQIKLNLKHFDDFMNQVDLHKQKKISFLDLKTVLSAYEIKRKQPRNVDREIFKRILLKISEIIKVEDFRLRICFECEEEETGIVSLQKFEEILVETGKFSKEETELILNPIALPFIKFERVNYLNFLKLGEFYQNELKSIELTEDTSGIQILKIMREISGRQNYDKYLLFSLFDRCNKGEITAVDIEGVFFEMKITFEKKSVSNIVEIVGKKKKGAIDLREFCAFFDKIE